MSLIEENTHSFIVKIWLEETVEENGRATWKGYVMDVSTNQRHYLKNLTEIADFIAPYLERMQVKLGMFYRVRQWFRPKS